VKAWLDQSNNAFGVADVTVVALGALGNGAGR